MMISLGIFILIIVFFFSLVLVWNVLNIWSKVCGGISKFFYVYVVEILEYIYIVLFYNVLYCLCG